ncbi:heat-inducible transcriptional repressor HrcA [Planococcaceae bacterium Storch 2/2-2]|nr:heat-inducible transcriptional repressor HrcA [Planococcaceae bacterium Storch 2/2-2]
MLTSRQLLILQLTVNDFIESAQPVGSRQLSKKPEAPFSPATIRNEMADLEEMGFLEKTHSSSGRIPSEKGYRFYVDHLMRPVHLEDSEVTYVRSLFQREIVESEELIRNTASILSDLTSYTAVLLGPDHSMHTVKQFDVVSLNNEQAVAIIVTDTGRVESRTFDVPNHLDVSDIEKLVNILNDRLVGTPLSQLHYKLQTEVYSLLERHIERVDEWYRVLVEAMTVDQKSELFFSGKLNMMKQPEFHDLEKVEVLFSLMDRSTPATTFFRGNERGIHVRIGSENEHDAMEDCSIITADYTAGTGMDGAIAIIGPKRMDYERVVSILDVISHQLSDQFERRTTRYELMRRNER